MMSRLSTLSTLSTISATPETAVIDVAGVDGPYEPYADDPNSEVPEIGDDAINQDVAETTDYNIIDTAEAVFEAGEVEFQPNLGNLDLTTYRPQPKAPRGVTTPTHQRSEARFEAYTESQGQDVRDHHGANQRGYDGYVDGGIHPLYEERAGVNGVR